MNDKQPSKRKRSATKSKPVSIDEVLQREQPVNLEAEMAVLASILMLPDVCDELVHIIRSTDFFDPGHSRMFHHLMEMHGSGQKIDIALLRERLIKNQDYDKIGNALGLARILESVATPAHAKYYAGIVQEKSTLRSLIGTCTDVMTAAFQPGENANSLLETAERQVLEIRETRQPTRLTVLEATLQEAIDRLEKRARGETLEGSVDSGFRDIDRLTGGLHASELVIIAARPSMGKTAFALNIAENVVLSTGRPVVFISLEMSAIELTERLLCSVARVNGHRLRNGTLTSEDQRRFIEEAGRINKARLFIDDSPNQTISQIAAVARRVKRRENDLALVVVDYLQLIEPDNSSDPRQEQVAKIARRMKQLAKELKVPVICLSQLNRQLEESRDHRPRLSHLRESGAIEQDADVVMFVHRKDYFKAAEEIDENDAGKALIIVAKQRNGPTDDIDVAWLREFTRFEDLAPERFSEFDQYTEPTYSN
ncbi:MAG TPA: replicative DNA helicase [Pirellulaceae bacterium]|nr:replicative DNA helicase [Pirellulaceae bacterium]